MALRLHQKNYEVGNKSFVPLTPVTDYSNK
jgi:hypothetical protein